MASDLLHPPAVCKIANGKSGSSFIAVENTERISSMISSSVISHDRRTLPISPFRLSISRIARPLGILISPFLLLLDFGRQIMSRLYIIAFSCFLVRSQPCNLFFRKVVGRTLLHVEKKKKKFVIANRVHALH